LPPASTQNHDDGRSCTSLGALGASQASMTVRPRTRGRRSRRMVSTSGSSGMGVVRTRGTLFHL